MTTKRERQLDQILRTTEERLMNSELKLRLRDFYQAAKDLSMPRRPMNAGIEFKRELDSLVAIWEETHNRLLAPMIDILERIPDDYDKFRVAEELAPLAVGEPNYTHPWVQHYMSMSPKRSLSASPRYRGLGAVI